MEQRSSADRKLSPPFTKNPAPTDEVKLQGQPPTWKLWEYDVVEVFFVCSNGNYVETEFGPHGHYLILIGWSTQHHSKRHCV